MFDAGFDPIMKDYQDNLLLYLCWRITVRAGVNSVAAPDTPDTPDTVRRRFAMFRNVISTHK